MVRFISLVGAFIIKLRMKFVSLFGILAVISALTTTETTELKTAEELSEEPVEFLEESEALEVEAGWRKHRGFCIRGGKRPEGWQILFNKR